MAWVTFTNGITALNLKLFIVQATKANTQSKSAEQGGKQIQFPSLFSQTIIMLGIKIGGQVRAIHFYKVIS
jgi:hypothetical protein